MIGPFIGGVLTDPATTFGGIFDTAWWIAHPYFLPCLFAGTLSATSFICALTYLPESLPPDSRVKSDGDAPKGLNRVIKNLVGVRDLSPGVRTLILVNALFLLSFTMMHATFILFTGMEVIKGGLGYDAYQNGLIFAYVGLVGVIVQGGLIRPLVKRFNPRHLMITGILVCGLGLAWIPYLEPTPFTIGLVAMTCIAVGNGLFQPTQNTLLTFEARAHGLDLGRVMGSQEGFGALSRVIGPITAGFVWAETVDGSGFWTYHTVFRICGVIMVFAAIAQIGLKLTADSEEE
jgi:DHA1 family tetracycline resistance protein-like MFS transporter